MQLSESEISRLLMSHSAGTSPGFLLWRSVLRWQRQVTAVLKDESLTHVQFSVLSTIWWFDRQGHVPSQRDVSNHASLDRVMMSQVVRLLERDGLVERTVDEHDGRVRRLRITPEGRTVADRAVALMDATDNAFFGVLDDLPGFIAGLSRLAGVTELASATDQKK
ncbi:winged helix-turn-helix transcriptional regulator [Dactylosporangium roseum]|uniref:Winged helix-turn-helix transcriptional regulator n=1 Tax=Dactylosporangium roseum TaxID=47989 RepID=A0ABY5YYV5_9ACTN|nr:MarR family winged helix-turn-helix transcriptional regulator [Dactylosporangium roseum]UWZ34576.1 winged helix-turn-helix transcriptional regulator [Dactylosporangium roseum]